ncbi:hypothetical protein SAMN04488137_1028 [Fictibacillus solisalsi]|uniref:Uncharacterized protein n=1 Tax=Fictibacillus solisalsi TaxID=459525 RepID=A0A1G9UN92_9BACL|nr:hypothetical protein SAMN04488137_1028 [Fictibacillus solisalsi]
MSSNIKKSTASIHLVVLFEWGGLLIPQIHDIGKRAEGTALFFYV